MSNMNLVNSITKTLNERYRGLLDCEVQRADLFVSIDGNEETIVSIDTEQICFENEAHNVKLVNADIRHLAYINAVI